MAKPAKVTEQPLEGVVHLGNDGKYHLGETGLAVPCTCRLSPLLLVQ